VTSSRRIARLAFVLALAAPAFSRAAEPGSGTPYKLTVVLDVAKNRVLTDVLRQQVERELREGIQAALGDLATVDVVRDHPKLAEVRSQGLKRALDSWKERSEVKTHFVLIDLVNNQYEIQARQHDGPTGVSSPVVRADRTPDRAFVARTAALLIKQDFGFTGTFRSWPAVESLLNQPQEVQLDLLGVGLGAPLSRWVKPGDVFSVVQMFSDKPPQVVPGALVQIKDGPREDAPDTSCVGNLFWRHERPHEGADHAGYRCVKLGTIQAPVRLRILQQKTDNSLVPLQASVEVRRVSFKGDEGVFKGGSNPSGFFTTATRADVPPYDHVAFITISSGGKVRVLLPLPLVDDQTVPVAVRVITEQVDVLAEKFDHWQRQVDDAWLLQVNVFENLKEMAAKAGTSREKIVEYAQSGLKRTSDDFANLNQEKNQIGREPPSRRGEMKRLEAVLHELNKGEKMLAEFTASQEKIVKEESRPEMKTAKAELADAQLAEQRADYDQAIELYKKAVPVLKTPDLEKHLAKLDQDWVPKGETHEKARKFIYETFPKLDTPGLDREMDRAKKALEQFKEVRDYLSPKKLILATTVHLSRVKKETEEIKPDLNEADDKTGQRLAKVSAELKKLLEESSAFLQTAGKDDD
jgi:hypothetical protein